MKLHYHPLSPYSRKAYVAVLLHEAPVEGCEIELGTGALERPEFLAISPFGKIPVLETDDGPLVESTSIVELLEERGPRRLLPPGSERVARHFDRLADLYLIAPVAALWWEPESPAGREASGVATRAWALFSRQLADGRPFVCGSDFTLGDLGGAIASDYFARLDVAPPSDIRSWVERCMKVPAMARSLAEALPWVERTLGARHPR